MNPNELEKLSAAELSLLFCRALIHKAIASAQDVFAQLESRFHRLTTSAQGSQKFLDGFLALAGRPEVRSMHLDDPLVRCVVRLEYLLELAGDRARVQTDEATLRQIVASRERGFDLIQALANAPSQGLTASQLAKRLEVTPQNLSPLIRTFHAHWIIDRSQQGKNAFLKLTPQGRTVLDPTKATVTNNVSVDDNQPVFVPFDGQMNGEERGRKILQEAIREVSRDILDAPFQSKRAMLGVAVHGLRRIEEQYRVSNPEAAAILRGVGEEIKCSMGIVSEAAREILNDLHSAPDSSKQTAVRIVRDGLARAEELHRESAPLAAAILHTFGEGVSIRT